MSHRPLDWMPLASCDPLPGEPEAIEREADRLRHLGIEMRTQIAGLRQIADRSTMVGRAADELRVASGELVVGLEKAVGRHERTAAALGAWHGELRDFQRGSVKALDIALEAQWVRARAEALRVSSSAAAGALTGVGLDPAREYEEAIRRADELLAQARQMLASTLAAHRERDRHFARLIDDATDDDAEDGRWDDFKDWVDRNQGWIHGWTEGLGWAATIAAGALLLVPGANLGAVAFFTWTAVGTTVATAAGHGALVSAGHASKVDVALDVFALATFGAGRVVASGLRSTQAATRVAAAQAARRAATDASLEASRTTREAAERVLADSTSTSGARRGARDRLDRALDQAERAGTQAASDVRTAPLAQATPAEQRFAGNLPDARNLNDIRASQSAFPHDPGVAQTAAAADRLALSGRAYYYAGGGSDIGDRFLDDHKKVEPYMRLKGHFTHEVGSTW